jgi:hypothetical protein
MGDLWAGSGKLSKRAAHDCASCGGCQHFRCRATSCPPLASANCRLALPAADTFPPFTRRMPAARSGLSRPKSEPSYANRRIAANVRFMVDGAYGCCSSAIRHRVTTALLKASLPVEVSVNKPGTKLPKRAGFVDRNRTNRARFFRSSIAATRAPITWPRKQTSGKAG